MRRHVMLFLGLALLGAAPTARVYAQSRQAEDDERRKAEAEEEANKKKKEKEWNTAQAPLPAVRNAGPCPFVKVLYDASRYVELKEGKENAQSVGWTGEIEGIKAACEYKGAEPIRVALNASFSLGRGPQAEGAAKDYRYWVAVTERNQNVLSKQTFNLHAVFPPGQDRITVQEPVQDIVIPRASEKISGASFEILVGFEVTPQMAEFNRAGKRFRVNAGAAQTASAGGAASQK